MDFVNFKKAVQDHFAELSKDAEHIYEVAVDKDVLWQLYLDSFPAGTNEIFRQRREFDCACCQHFIRAMGNVVFIKDCVVHTIWELSGLDEKFQAVADALDAFIKSQPIMNVYVSKFSKIGTDKNHETLPDGTVRTWDHLYLELPSKFVDKSNRSIGDIQGSYRDTRNVFLRSLDEINAAVRAKEVKDQREKIMAILADKQDQDLRSKTPEELQAMLNQLG